MLFLYSSLLLKSRRSWLCLYCFLSRKSAAAADAVIGLRIGLTENNILVSPSIRLEHFMVLLLVFQAKSDQILN